MSVFKSYIEKMQMSYEEFCRTQNPKDYVTTRYEEDGSFSVVFLHEKFCNDYGIEPYLDDIDYFGKEVVLTIQEPNKLLLVNGVNPHERIGKGGCVPFGDAYRFSLEQGLSGRRGHHLLEMENMKKDIIDVAMCRFGSIPKNYYWSI
jgi:hypothetical protein